MAEWKTQVNYNYNPSYAHSYGFMYPPGSEQNNGNLSGWNNGGLTDLNNFNAGVNQAYYAAPARTQEESPPESPEEASFNGLYPNSGLVYFGETRAPYEVHKNEGRRAGSDTASDNSEHTSRSPDMSFSSTELDSWSSGSGSSQEGSLPHANPATWVRKNLNDETDPARWMKEDIKSEVANRIPDATVEVSSSLKKEPPHGTFAAMGNETVDTTTSSTQMPMTGQNNPNPNPKGKGRVAFTESQMEVLHTRFSVQRYLTPAEMKQLAEVTGLTYKQVKTWFQNRRMKLRRHQKDKNWVSERYALHRTGPVGGPVFPNYSSHIQPYPGEARPPVNQHMMEAAFKNPPPNLAFYLAAMGNAPGSAGYSSWSPGTPQSTFPNSPQTPSWPVPSAVGPYEYPPSVFNPGIINTTSQDAIFGKDQEQINRSPFGAATEHNVTQ